MSSNSGSRPNNLYYSHVNSNVYTSLLSKKRPRVDKYGRSARMREDQVVGLTVITTQPKEWIVGKSASSYCSVIGRRRRG